ncbi:MAG: 7TM diverse intracellular signaling domain-containing protein [Bacteroidota bacterium]
MKSIAVIVLMMSLGQSATSQPVVQGRVNLSQHTFGNGHPVDLSGTWGFYWNKLLTPEDIDRHQISQWIEVPGSWHRQGPYSTLGFATYRLALTLPDQNNLSLYFPIINASAKIWINGELVMETGRTGTGKNSYSSKLSSTIVSLPEKTRDLDIIMQVANYSYFSGGVGATPLLDKTSSLHIQINNSNGVKNFFAGSLIAMFMYQLILYLLFQRGNSYLWLALICLGVALRALITHGGSFLLPTLYPSVDWEYWKKIEFGSVYAIVAIFPLYVYHLFPAHAPKKPLIIFITIAITLCLAVMVTPQYRYGQLLEISHIGLLLAFIYAVYSISKAWKSGNTDARIILLGVLAAFPFILAEILKNSVLYPVNIQFMYLVESGVLVFLLFQVYLLANHYAKSYKSLETLNQNLEMVVAERTNELTTANAVKNRLLSVLSHDIKSPLNSLQGILQLYKSEALSKEEFGNFTQRLEGDLSKTNLLVENILYWTASQLKGVQTKRERFNLHVVIEENCQLFRSIADIKKITLQNNTPESFTLTADRDILNFVIRNLMANAIKYSFEGGTVTSMAHVANQVVTIQVKDNGVGMDETTLHALLTPDRTVSSPGTRLEKGTGLGLILCREYLQRVGGTLTIESSPGKGSIISIAIPLKN